MAGLFRAYRWLIAGAAAVFGAAAANRMPPGSGIRAV